MSRVAVAVAILLAALVIATSPRFGDSFAASERARVRAHLDSAERELRATPQIGLSAGQRGARARALDRLHEYWVRGVFPRNTDFPGQYVPYFIDRSGTRCAMAYLIEESGLGGFVARVATTNNNARIPALRHDPELLAWLDQNGVTLEEAARIQPSYCDLPPEQQLIPCVDPTDPVQTEASTGYKTATALSVGADVLVVALNSTTTRLSPTGAGVAGIVSGAVGVAIGAPNLDESGSLATLGWVNVSAGVVSAAVGTYNLLRKPANRGHLIIGPWLQRTGAPGVRASLSF